MEFDILYAIQNIRCQFLDGLFVTLTDIVGSYGYLWLAVGALLCVFKKTRKCGFAVLLSYALVFVTGQFVLKDWIARVRPCNIDTAVELLVARPSSYSCPSTHTAWSFAAATAIFMDRKKWGIGAFVLATLIGFSRMYLFVHFPTDVLVGVVLGVAAGIGAVYIVRLISKQIDKKLGRSDGEKTEKVEAK